MAGASRFKRMRVIDRLFYDSQPIYDQPYLSLLTHVSEVLWCMAAFACLFAFAIAQTFSKRRQVTRFLLSSGVGLLMLMTDDLLRITLLLHVIWGIPRLLMYGLYSIATLAYLRAYWRLILKTPYTLLGIAIAWFVLSGLLDSLSLPLDGTLELLHNVLEEATKLLGCLHIALYFWQVSLQSVRSMLRQVALPYS